MFKVGDKVKLKHPVPSECDPTWARHLKRNFSYTVEAIVNDDEIRLKEETKSGYSYASVRFFLVVRNKYPEWL